MKKTILLVTLIFSAVIGMAQTTLYTRDTLAINPVFRQRVKSATVFASQQIAADTANAFGYREDHYLNRRKFANEVIKNPDGGWISSMSYQVIAEGIITYGSTDGDIQFTVNSNFTKVAEGYFNYVAPVPYPQE